METPVTTQAAACWPAQPRGEITGPRPRAREGPRKVTARAETQRNKFRWPSTAPGELRVPDRKAPYTLVGAKSRAVSADARPYALACLSAKLRARSGGDGETPS